MIYSFPKPMPTFFSAHQLSSSSPRGSPRFKWAAHIHEDGCGQLPLDTFLRSKDLFRLGELPLLEHLDWDERVHDVRELSQPIVVHRRWCFDKQPLLIFASTSLGVTLVVQVESRDPN